MLHILSEESIKVYLVYMDQLKGLFTKFIHENWNARKRVSFHPTLIINLFVGAKLERHRGVESADESECLCEAVQDQENTASQEQH